MSIHRAQRPDGWRALVERENEREHEGASGSAHAPSVVSAARSADPAVAAELARWENEGGPVDSRRPARIPVNEAVRDLVRACLIPHACRPMGA
jgi:hypothetical protein